MSAFRPLLCVLALAACSAAPADNPATNGNSTVASRSINAAAPATGNEVPLADRPAPEPIVGRKPIEGEFDPDIMTVTLAGERIVVEDAKHSWPLHLDQSTYEFARNGLASFGTPALSHGPADCPAGKLDFLDYANGLQLAFQDGKLAGYWVKEGARGIATQDGIRPGDPRSKLGKRQVDEASFGKIVDLDGTFAILDEKGAKVTDLYAGAACIYD